MITGKFKIGETNYVVVNVGKVAHVMTEKDWRRCYGNLHPERWKK